MADNESTPHGSEEELLLSGLLAESPELWGVVDEFVRQLPDRAEPMQDALRAQSFDRLQTLAAELRQAGTRHGCAAIAERAAAIEQAAHDHLLDELTDKIDALRTLIAGVRESLQGSGQ